MDSKFVKEAAKNIQQELTEIRRTLHQNPEVGPFLPQTKAFVRKKLEDFFKKMEEEYGGGSAEAMFQTFEQLDRARQRAEERAADAEAAQQAAEWATEALEEMDDFIESQGIYIRQ